MAQEERVLVVERKVLEQVGMFQGLVFDSEKYFSKLFVSGTPRFMPRAKAESDPSYKQLIPYVLITCGGKFLTYIRGKRAGETRLVGNRSIGIGGHINPSDDMPLFSDFYQAYLTAVEREVAEEISIEAKHTNHVVALLNDDSREVGKVHLGIVHCWVLDAPKVERREQMITQLTFMTVPELQQERGNMETWSQLCLDNIAEITKQIESKSRL